MSAGVAPAGTMEPRPASDDARVIALITIGHFFSHFYILALPPLFPVLVDAFSVSATELGIAIAVLNISTALLQAPVGFLVDRVGAAAVLIGGQLLFAVATALVGLWPNYGFLVFLMVVAGIGNSVYHPADYAVLAGRVSSARMGRAFAVHTAGGHFGFAAAPVVMVGLTAVMGWQAALGVVGVIGVIFAGILYVERAKLTVLELSTHRATGRRDAFRLDLLASAPVLLALLFFTFIAMAQSGITSFSVLALERQYGFDLIQGNTPLTLFLLASAFGVLAGGFVADTFGHHRLVVAIGAVTVAASALVVGLVPLSATLIGVLFVIAGAANGALSPSRDMIVRQIAPPGDAGKVFGFVTTGFNIGGLVAPPILGLAIDFGQPAWVFVLTAIFALGMLTATVVPRRTEHA